MGIPKFFKWLSKRYPLLLKDVKKDSDIPPFDNLYLDMNGIVHFVIHGNTTDKIKKTTKKWNSGNPEEIFTEIFTYIDDIVHIVNPRQLLFLALDSVTPIAKMTQQRSRRAKSVLTTQADSENVLFDTNAISPGSEFMALLNKHLNFFLEQKMNTDPLYQRIKVIFSDCNVPGEGEHKIMDYLRYYQASETYNPNLRHCIYGQDADLIMLTLISHEPNFAIFREEIKFQKPPRTGLNRQEYIQHTNFQLLYVSILRQYLHLEFNSLALLIKFEYDLERIIDDFIFFCFFIGNDFLPYLNTMDIGEGSLDEIIKIYKQLLPELDGYITDTGVINWKNAEKIIKCLAKSELKSLQNRMVSSSKLETISRQDKGEYEDISEEKIKEIRFGKKVAKVKRLKDKGKAAVRAYKKILKEKKKEKEEKGKKEKEEKMKLVSEESKTKDSDSGKHEEEKDEKMVYNLHNIKAVQEIVTGDLRESESGKVGVEIEQASSEEEKKESKEEEEEKEGEDDLKPSDIPDSEVSEVEETEQYISDNENTFYNGLKAQNKLLTKNKKFLQNLCLQYEDGVGKAKEYYYKEKLHMDINTQEGEQQINALIKKYLEGLQWVLFYYYKGVVNWGWVYNYHYAPLVSDITNVEELINIHEPMTFDYMKEDNQYMLPLQQLLTILPKASKNLLPKPYQKLHDNDSEIKDLYPSEFESDLNGRTLPWEAVVLIPFIDKKRIVDAEARVLSEARIEKTKKNMLHLGKTWEEDLKIKEEVKEEEEVKRDILELFVNPKEKKTMTEDVLTEEELKRNEIHSSLEYVYIPASSMEKIESPLKNFPSIINSKVFVQPINIHPPTGQFYSFKPILKPNTIWPCCDFPSFNNLNVLSLGYKMYAQNKIDFQKAVLLISNQPVIPAIEPPETATLPENLGKLLNEIVYIGYPFQEEAIMRTIFSKTHKFFLKSSADGNLIEFAELSERDSGKIFQKAEMQSDFKGLKLHPFQDSEFICECFPIFGIRKNYRNNGELEKVYDKYPILACSNLVMTTRDPNHYLNIDEFLQGKDKQYQINSKCVVTFGKTFGLLGQISEFSPPMNLKIQLLQYNLKISKKNCLALTEFIKEKEGKVSSNFMGFQSLSYELGWGIQTLAKITSSVLVDVFDPETRKKDKFDVGLKIKNSKRRQHIPFFARYNSEIRSWEFHVDILKIIAEYQDRYPTLFQLVDYQVSQPPQRYKQESVPIINAQDIFPDASTTQVQEEMKILIKWLDCLPIAGFPSVPQNSQILHPALNDLVCQHNDQLKKNSGNATELPLKIKQNCKDVFVEYFPFPLPSPGDYNKKYELGDVVLNIKTRGKNSVNFGERGIVVAVSDRHALVQFDEKQITGSSCNGQCKPFRGKFMEKSSLLNLSLNFKEAEPEEDWKREERDNYSHNRFQRGGPRERGGGGRGPFRGGGRGSFRGRGSRGYRNY